MNKIVVFLLLLSVQLSFGQSNNMYSPFDARHWGVVLDDPAMKTVKVLKDVPYLKDDKGSLHIDIYQPVKMIPGKKYPAVVFLNGLGDQVGQAKIKSWEIYSTWPRLIATQGMIGIAMECDGQRIQESIDGVFKYLDSQGKNYSIDAEHLGVYAASANVGQSAAYLMKDSAYKGIKAAVLYYGAIPASPFRKDLPVYFVVAEGDVRGNNYQQVWSNVLLNKAPWTIKMASNLPHAFDAFSDLDEARIVVKETISFWKNHLEPVARPSWKNSEEREIVANQYWQKHTEVAASLQAWFKNHPESKDISAHQLYARSLMNSGSYEQAKTVHEKRLILEPENSFTLLDLAVVSEAMGQSTVAENYLKQYDQKAGLKRSTYTFMSFALLRAKKYKQAAHYFEKALEMEPTGQDYFNLACCQALAGEADSAFGSLNKALEYGFINRVQFEQDEDLESLHSDSRWNTLLGKLQ